VPTLCFFDGEILLVVTCGSDGDGDGDGGGGGDARACMRACRGRACTRACVGIRCKAMKGRDVLFALFFSTLSLSLSLSRSLSLSLRFFSCYFFFRSFLSLSFFLSFSVRLFDSRCSCAAWGVWCNESENQYPSTDKYRPRLATARAPPRKSRSLQRENGMFSLPP